MSEKPKPQNTVRYAARLASRFYLDGKSEKTATLSQCIAAASRETSVPMTEITNYLLGCGARAVCNNLKDGRGRKLPIEEPVTVYHVSYPYDDFNIMLSDYPEDVNVITIKIHECFMTQDGSWVRKVKQLSDHEDELKIRRLANEAEGVD